MTVENAIRTAYANHLLLNFGNDGLAMFHELPDFTALRGPAGVLVTAPEATESQHSVLAKALELFASQHGTIVYFNGERFVPAAVNMVA